MQELDLIIAAVITPGALRSLHSCPRLTDEDPEPADRAPKNGHLKPEPGLFSWGVSCGVAQRWQLILSERNEGEQRGHDSTD